MEQINNGTITFSYSNQDIEFSGVLEQLRLELTPDIYQRIPGADPKNCYE